MDVREKLVDIVKRAAYHCLPSNTKDFHINMFVADLLAHGATVQEWIPVTERLPEIDGQYLCNYHFGNHRDMTFTRVLDYYATDEIPHFQHTLGDTTMKVTHWMPLPEPPKGE